MKNNRIEINQKIMVGKPVIRGTRIPIDAILQRLAEGLTTKEILEDYPNITKQDIKAVLEYAAEVIRGEDILLKMSLPRRGHFRREYLKPRQGGVLGAEKAKTVSVF